MPEAFHDAFARLHRCFEADVRTWKAGGKVTADGSKYASVEDGWTGIAFHRDLSQEQPEEGRVDGDAESDLNHTWRVER